MIDPVLQAAAARVLAVLVVRGETVATAESCTGGLVAAALTAIPGSSSVVERGFVTYSNAAKTELLGVPPALIARHGAVSAEVARMMAEGALARAPVTRAVAITGIAGPASDGTVKPVGLVHFALARRGVATHDIFAHFDGDRDQIRLQAALAALDLLAKGGP